ncbi:unnamed protein product [Periconia digitata]|uniref:Acyl-coenzyme A oxidase n=1 Tax=Periconia digitata TaxID=1303443 RepID=A0A9W4UIX0_9PLEO|nr:unnamed protein product [Periconia digitata]
MANRQTQLMTEARARGTINTTKLAGIIHGGDEIVRLRREAWSRVEAATGASETSKLPVQYALASREDLYREGLQEGKAAQDDMKRYHHTFFDVFTPRYRLSNYSPFGLTTWLIKPTLEHMATQEQKKRFQNPDWNWAYAQTELGHGTFVRGLETTASFDQARDAFVIHSPTTTSSKYWPGSLAFSASHAVVMARLLIGERDHGIHAFVVQLRDADGSLMQGIELGDIGLKSSYNQNDNGYARFDHVSIPRDNMLMARSQVSKNGIYSTLAAHPKAAYSTMLVGRVGVAQSAAFQLAQATTIAIRYSVVREQGTPAFGIQSNEVPVMHYKSQQYRLLTSLANAYAIHFATRHAEEMVKDFERRQAGGDYSTMANVHVVTAGIKAWATSVGFDGAADARKACGGHGYLSMSGLPEVVDAMDALCTLEGDNIVMFQQVARHLMKIMEGNKVDPNDSMRHTCEPIYSASQNLLDSTTQKNLFKHRATNLARRAFNSLQKSQAVGKSKSDAWNEHAMLLISAAKAHFSSIVLDQFASQIDILDAGREREVLRHLQSLFALAQITSPLSPDTASFFGPGLLHESEMEVVHQQTNVLLDTLVPEAVALTDAWDFSDASLASAIGMKDGNAYERLMSWTKQLPMNVEAAERGGMLKDVWERYIQPKAKL